MRNMAELDTAGPVVWPKWCYSDNLESEPALSPEKISKVPVGRARRKKPTTSRAVVKTEPLSLHKSPDPDNGTESCGSASPQSPGSSQRLSLGGTPPAMDRFSPAAQLMNHKILVDGFNMSRNYSEFMRSLAAKYNNNNTNYRSGYIPPPLTPTRSSAGISNLPQAGRREPERFAGSSPPKKPDASVSFPTGLMTALNAAPLMDMSSTQALLSLVRSAQNSQKAADCSATKRRLDLTHPLDLSAPVAKKPLLDFTGSRQLEADHNVRNLLQIRNPFAERFSSPKKSPSPPANSAGRCRSTCPADFCSPAAAVVNGWNVEDVVEFVKSIDVCADYAPVFQDHSIDGSTLPLLSEDHLTNRLNMKLGPALKLRSAIARKIGHCALCLHCVHCHRESDILEVQSSSPV